MKIIILLASLLFGFSAFSLVDTKNANYSKTFVDINLEGKGLPFLVERTYNSRSLYKGLFGYGWCSNFETRVEVLPDNSISAVECGGGMEINYVPAGEKRNPKMIVKKIMSQVRKGKKFSKKYMKIIEGDLKQSSALQSELIRALNLEGKAKTGQTYYASGRLGERLEVQNNQYKRFLPNGRVEFFNQNGQLYKKADRQGNWIKIMRDKNGRIIKVLNNEGKTLRFSYNSKGFVIKGPNKLKASFVVRKDNLVSATNSKEKTYEHVYDNYHNLTKTRYPDSTYESLIYNTDKDWVTSFRNRKNCKETYNYETNKNNKNHYWTDVKKVCGKRVTNISRYEFWNKEKPGKGGQYLYRARQKVNGDVLDVIYDHRTGSPLFVTRNNWRTSFSYNPDGSLKFRKTPNRHIYFSNYGTNCKKPNLVQVDLLQGKKVVRRIKTNVRYEGKQCHLVMASQKDTGRWVKIERDIKGRIKKISDQSKKIILITYNQKLNKPQKITRPGVGSIQVSYDENGEIDRSKTKTDPAVATQVTNVFNGFLELISPLVAEVKI